MSLKVYKHIEDLPVKNFLKVINHNDKRYLLILPDYFDLPVIDSDICEVAWSDIQSQIIDLNGISEDYAEILRIQRDIALGKVEIYSTGDLSGIALIKKKEKELLKLLESKGKSVDWMDLISKMEIEFKFQFDLEKMTVDRLFKYLKIYTDGRKSDHK